MLAGAFFTALPLLLPALLAALLALLAALLPALFALLALLAALLAALVVVMVVLHVWAIKTTVLLKIAMKKNSTKRRPFLQGFAHHLQKQKQQTLISAQHACVKNIKTCESTTRAAIKWAR